MTKKAKIGLLLLVWGIVLLQTALNLWERRSLRRYGAFREEQEWIVQTVKTGEKAIQE